MKRLEERRKDLDNAINKLKEGLKEEPDELRIDGVLQRFEFTFELAWKCIKDYLESQGIVSNIGSPREIIQLAFRHNLIDDGEKWIEMMLARNNLSHMYDESTSRKIYTKIKDEYMELLENLQKKI